RLGIGGGWRVWEVGAGGPTIPEGLARRGAHVLATDIDTSWLPADAPYEVRRHDVAADPPPPGPFDLVHARLVLVHVPARAAALAAMVSVLRPGGYLLWSRTPIRRCSRWRARTSTARRNASRTGSAPASAP